MTLSTLAWLSNVLAIAGAGVILAAMIGFLRMPDVYCRAHALGVATTFGFILVVLGLWLALRSEPVGLKLLAAILFQLLTIPVSTHLLLLQAHRNKVPRFSCDAVDGDVAERSGNETGRAGPPPPRPE